MLNRVLDTEISWLNADSRESVAQEVAQVI